MANPNIFPSAPSTLATPTPSDTQNMEGAAAFSYSLKHQLAVLAMTGFFPDATFYDPDAGNTQLLRLVEMMRELDDPVFSAQAAVVSRAGVMKDMPMAVLNLLAARTDREKELQALGKLGDVGSFIKWEHEVKKKAQLFHKVFDETVNNDRVMKTLWQMLFSGFSGRKLANGVYRKAFSRWLNNAPISVVVAASIGKDPPLRRIIMTVRPKPKDNERRALFGYLTDTKVEKWAPATWDDLPELVKNLHAYYRAKTTTEKIEILERMEGQRPPWQLLTCQARTPEVWRKIVRVGMGPKALRMNLNTLLRHGVYQDPEMVCWVCEQFSDPVQVRRAKDFPAAWFLAYKELEHGVPQEVRQALSVAATLACSNIPSMGLKLLIGIDLSGSMHDRATGHRGPGKTSKLSCREAACLFGCALLKQNPGSWLVPFSDGLYPQFRYDPGDTILSLARQMDMLPAGGTAVQLPVMAALGEDFKVQGYDPSGRKLLCPRIVPDQPWDGVVILSDNQSWIGEAELHNDRLPVWARMTQGQNSMGVQERTTTPLLEAWCRLVEKHKAQGWKLPKLVCADLQSYGTSQVPERADILNIGGFSDMSFSLVQEFMEGRLDLEQRFVALIEAVDLDSL